MARHRNTKLPTRRRSAILRSCALLLAARVPPRRRAPSARAQESALDAAQALADDGAFDAPKLAPPAADDKLDDDSRNTAARPTSSPLIAKVKECCGYPDRREGGLPPLLLLARLRVGVRQRALRHRHLHARTATSSAAIPSAFVFELKLEGSGILRDGRVLNYDGECNYGMGTCFKTLALERASARRRRAGPAARAVPLDRRRSALHPHRRAGLRARAGRRAPARRHAPRRLPARRRHGRRHQGAQARLLRRELLQLQVHRRQLVVAHEGDADARRAALRVPARCTTPRERDNEHTDLVDSTRSSSSGAWRRRWRCARPRAIAPWPRRG